MQKPHVQNWMELGAKWYGNSWNYEEFDELKRNRESWDEKRIPKFYYSKTRVQGIGNYYVSEWMTKSSLISPIYNCRVLTKFTLNQFLLFILYLFVNPIPILSPWISIYFLIIAIYSLLSQKHVLSSISKGKFVFITGSVGTGKTLLLEEIIKFLNRLYTPSEVYVTASTGVATCAIKGQTLHFFAGIGIFTDDDPQNLVERVLSHQGACRGWRKVEALVIDEINIVSTKLFDSLECVARGVTGVDET